ncbi:MAG TPA: M23 family metallopeptidase [Nitrospirota bacterium]|nr:M23 family metallopeptidase [Nitrospirota bacterium]
MNRFKEIFILTSLLCLPYIAHAQEKALQPEIILEPAKPGPGDLLVVTIKNAPGTPEGKFNNKKIYFNPSKDSFKAIVAIDYFTEPGKYDLEISSNGSTLKQVVEVIKKEYEVQQLTLPKHMVELSAKDEARAERDQQKMAAIWPNETGRSWTGDFVNPLEGEIITPFGVRRIINNIPKSPHTGVDVKGNKGDKIIAPNNAVVALVDNQFFAGKALVLNHGQGIYTMFFHLSKVLVKPGQEVKKGDVIALVGSTGRATGPHLHWGARVQGARIDPLELVHLKLE